jgi:hypothetical protein
VGFRVKSDVRNHQAIVQPRLYDCLMVTQITLNTEPHGFDSCQGHSYGKVTTTVWGPPYSLVPEAPAKSSAALSSRCVRAQAHFSQE